MMPYSRIENQRLISNNINRYTISDWLLKMKFTDFPQYKAGLIDEKGKLLVPRSKMSPKQKNQYSIYDAAVINMKRLMDQLPKNVTHNWKYQFAHSLMDFHSNMFESVGFKTMNQFLEEEDGGSVPPVTTDTVDNRTGSMKGDWPKKKTKPDVLTRKVT